MKRLVLLGLILLGNVWAMDMKEDWEYLSSKSFSSPDGSKTELKIFRRYINKSWFVSSATFAIIKPGRSASTLKQDIDQIKSNFKHIAWSEGKIKNGIVLLGYDSKTNRYLINTFRQIGNGNKALSTSSTRVGYLKALRKELLTLHASFSRFSQKEKKHLSMWSLIGVNTAHAQTLPFDVPSSTGGPSGDSSTLYVESDSTVHLEADDLIESMDANVDQLTTEMDDFQQDLDVIEQDLDVMQDLWADTNDIVDTQATRFNDTMEGFLELSEKMTSMEYIFTAGFVGAAAGALGVMAVNMVVDGIGAIINKIISAARERKEFSWEMMQQALNEWQDYQDFALNLEKQLDALVMAQEQLAAHRGEDLLEALKSENSKLERDISFYSRHLERIADDCFECSVASEEYSQLWAQVDGLKEILNDNQKILDYVTEKNINSLRVDDGFFCEQLGIIKRKLIDAERNLQLFRFFLVSGLGEWIEGEEEFRKDLERQARYINNPRRQEDIKENLLDLAGENLENEEVVPKRRWIDNCVRAENDAGRMIHQAMRDDLARRNRFVVDDDGNDIPLNNFGWYHFKIKGLCDDQYEAMGEEIRMANEAETSRLRESIETNITALMDEELKNNPLTIDYIAEAQNIDEMTLWLRKLNAQKYCIERWESLASSKKDACKRLSPMSVALHEGKNKAIKKWEETCAGQLEQLFDDIYSN